MLLGPILPTAQLLARIPPVQHCPTPQAQMELPSKPIKTTIGIARKQAPGHRLAQMRYPICHFWGGLGGRYVPCRYTVSTVRPGHLGDLREASQLAAAILSIACQSMVTLGAPCTSFEPPHVLLSVIGFHCGMDRMSTPATLEESPGKKLSTSIQFGYSLIFR